MISEIIITIEMNNRWELSQILSGITFDRNNIFDAGKLASKLHTNSFFPHQKMVPNYATQNLRHIHLYYLCRSDQKL